jgi:hypothetical protein
MRWTFVEVHDPAKNLCKHHRVKPPFIDGKTRYSRGAKFLRKTPEPRTGGKETIRRDISQSSGSLVTVRIDVQVGQVLFGIPL